MKGLSLLFCLVLCPLVVAFRGHELEHLLSDYIRRESRCYQDTPNCNECLSKPDCSWCSNGVVQQCTSTSLCPKESTFDHCTQLKTLNNPSEDITALLNDLNSLSSLGNSSRVASCSGRKNCSFCTSSQSCSWCEGKRKCLPYHGSSNATSMCGGNLWYKDQCLYSSDIKPCPQRTGGCKECTKDKVCFWCKSSGNCSYYPHDAYVPPDCPADSWYYDTCSHMSFWVVLAPILAILLAPVLIYIVIAIIVWCMRKFGGKDTDKGEDSDDDSSQASPLPEKKMILSHQPEPSRVEELRKKYNLGE